MNTVTLEQILESRENRAGHQKELIARYDASLISFMVNMPGPEKVTELTVRVHKAGMSAIMAALPKDSILFSEVRALTTGYEGYIAVGLEGKELKKIACGLEDTLAYGRLLDFDVFDKSGHQMSRTELGFQPRGCLVCKKTGSGCASRRLHALPEIIAAFEELARLA